MPNDNQFVKMEEDVLKFWSESDIFQKSIDASGSLGNFVFFEGPPTANGLPGIHHVLARAFKDVMTRYKTMRGFKVVRKAGWDTHGLPVELQVEKELGISGKPQIEEYGIAAFNRKCKESVWKYKDEWEKLTKRIGFWVDMEHPYVTYDNNYIESVWAILKKIYDRGLLYKGHKVVPHCPRCGTALSSHEVAQGYKTVKDNSVYLKFKLENSDDYILAWTTTPWTLPGNVALAVGKNIDYVKVKKNNENYILAKERLAVLTDYEIIAEMKGSELIGKTYEPLFEIPSILNSGKSAYKILSADFVTTSDGTGVVHTAVMYGEDDYQLGQQEDLPKIHTVLEDGKFTDELSAYGLAGKFVKSTTTEKIIIDYLNSKGLILQEEVYEHEYPFCWRCDTPLLYYAKDSWFVEISKLKVELLKNNQEINWIPEHVKDGRFGEWLSNIRDWAISRERYWGTPLPIWECASCGAIKVLGSAEGLELKDLHRPMIDEVELDCACGKKMKRIKEVLDCWFDSGSMPFAQYHYPFENQELIDKNIQFPAEYICEAIDQTRGWFYTLLAISTLLDKGAPYKNVICLGHINDKAGKKMSKSKGNIVDPWQMIEGYGVDAIRMHMYTVNSPGDYKRYDENDVRDVLRQNVMILWNVYKFYEMYQKDITASNQSTDVLDQWIIAKLNLLQQKLSLELDVYHIYEAAREIPVFIDELSTWYLRRSRDRFKAEDNSEVLSTLKFVLIELAKVIAPFMPFVAESLWQKVTGNNFTTEQSVHLEKWNTNSNKINQEVLDNMAITRKIVELGLAARDAAGIKIRQVLAKAMVDTKAELSDSYLDLIKDELNVKAIVLDKNSDELKVALDTEITPALKREGLKRELVRLINNLRKDSGFTLADSGILYLDSDDEEINQTITEFGEEIKKDTLCVELKQSTITASKDITLGTAKVQLAIEKQ